MYEIKFSNYLYEDVKSSVNYIKYILQNPAAARRLKNEVKKAYKKVKENPYAYPAAPVECLAQKGYRFIKIKNYLLFFKVREKQIYIERFLYGPRDWINIIGNMN